MLNTVRYSHKAQRMTFNWMCIWIVCITNEWKFSLWTAVKLLSRTKDKFLYFSSFILRYSAKKRKFIDRLIERFEFVNIINETKMDSVLISKSIHRLEFLRLFPYSSAPQNNVWRKKRINLSQFSLPKNFKRVLLQF